MASGPRARISLHFYPNEAYIHLPATDIPRLTPIWFVPMILGLLNGTIFTFMRIPSWRSPQAKFATILTCLAVLYGRGSYWDFVFRKESRNRSHRIAIALVIAGMGFVQFYRMLVSDEMNGSMLVECIQLALYQVPFVLWTIAITILGGRGFGRPAGQEQPLPNISPSRPQAKTSEYHSCFISYSSKDQLFTERLHADLQKNGVECWIAHHDMKIGDPIRQRIDDAIRGHDKLLVVLSANSINSSWVGQEVEIVFEAEQQQNKPVLFPLRLDDELMKTNLAWATDIRRNRHIGDFKNWQDQECYSQAFTRLLRDLKIGSQIDPTGPGQQ